MFDSQVSKRTLKPTTFTKIAKLGCRHSSVVLVYAYHIAASGSNPKHTIYAF